MTVQTCIECRRPLSPDGVMCIWRDCPAYGQNVGEPDDTADRFTAWLARHPDLAGLRAWNRFQAEERAA